MKQKLLQTLLLLTIAIGVVNTPVMAQEADADRYKLSHEGILQEGYFLQNIEENTASDEQVVLAENLQDSPATYDAERVKQVILQAVKNCEPEIDLSSFQILVEDMDKLISELLNDNPQLYYVAFDECTIEDGKVNVLFPVYIGSQENVTQSSSAYEAAINRAMGGLDSRMNDLEKALELHNWLAQNCAYGRVSGNESVANTAYGALVDGKAVCAGYMLAYAELLSRAGIENAYVSSSSMNHAWNLVKIDGQWYHVDVTWDDKWEKAYSPTYDLYHDYNNIMCRWFMLSDSGMLANSHSNWKADYAATSTRFDAAFWHDSKLNNYWNGLYFLDGNWYYQMPANVAPSGDWSIYRVSGRLETGAHSIWMEKGEYWRYEDGSFSSPFYDMALFEGYLYYNTQDKVYRYDGKNEPELFYEGDKVLYGLIIRDGVLQAEVTNPYMAENGYEYMDLKASTNGGGSGSNQIFTDVTLDAWYYDAVNYAYTNGIMSGTGNNKFAPETVTSRSMVVQILYNISGKPSVSGSSMFADAPAGQWYSNAVQWAVENNITSGISATQFAPNQNVSRQEVACFLYRYANCKGYDTSGRNDLSSFADSAEVDRWALEAMQWANNAGIINGKGNSKLDPKGPASRAEIATMMKGFMTKYQ